MCLRAACARPPPLPLPPPLTRKAEEREAGQPAHSSGPCSLGLHQKEAWGPEDQPGLSQLQGGSRRAGRGTAESQATELELAVPKAKKSESPTLLGVQRPVLSQTHTPSICSCPLAHANPLNPQPSAAHLPPSSLPPSGCFLHALPQLESLLTFESGAFQIQSGVYNRRQLCDLGQVT